MTDKLTAHDMHRMLSAHYFPAGKIPMGLLIKEIGSPCGTRRADALYLPRSTHSTQTIIGHEIKVSRADIIVELNDPAKVDPWLRYCDQWWLVISDPALIEGLDIPVQWGILSPPSGRRKIRMTVIRDAPQLHPIHLAPAMRRLVSHMMDNLVREIDGKKYEMDRLQNRYETTRDELAELKRSGVAIAPPELSPEEQAARELISQLAIDGRNKQVQWMIRTDPGSIRQIASVINDLELAKRKSRDAVRMIERTISQVRSVIGPVDVIDRHLTALRESVANEHESLFGEAEYESHPDQW